MNARRCSFFRVFLLLLLSCGPGPAQDPPWRITDPTLAPGGKVRIPIQTSLADPDTLLIESAYSPFGPWAKEADFQRNIIPGGREFLLPILPREDQRFYRARQLVGDTKPWIRFVAPREFIKPGRVVTLLGQRFSSIPGENIVRFERGTNIWTVAASESTTETLSVTVPAELPATPPAGDPKGVSYRVSVTNAAGTSNGVGCWVSATGFHGLTIRPTSGSVVIFPPPGMSTEKLLVGGGTPPYQLVPQTPADAAKVLAQLNGSIVTVTGMSGFTFASVTVKVRDSGTPQQEVQQSISLLEPFFEVPFTPVFRTLLAGTAPVLSVTSKFDSIQPEEMDLKFQNLQIDMSTFRAGQRIGMVRLYSSSGDLDQQQIIVREASSGQLKFDVISFAGGTTTTSARGELVANPPSLRVTTVNGRAASFMPTTVNQEVIFEDGIFRLPATPGQTVTLMATYTSVSRHPTQYLPIRRTVAPVNFVTTGTAGAPRLERVLPSQGEIRRTLLLRGTGFAADPAQNSVTFAGRAGTRVPATITGHNPGELIVSVPREAISGPVRVKTEGQTSNDYRFVVRFAPVMILTFPSFTGDTPVAPRLLHQQPVDEGETIGEVPPRSFTATIDRGRLAVAGLTVGQLVGTTSTLNGYSGQTGTYEIRYRGMETAPPNRHRFEIDTFGIVVATLYAQDDPDGDGVVLDLVNATSFNLDVGLAYDHRFSAAIYRPPPAGNTVTVRLEAQSEPWMPGPGSAMRVIENSSLKTTAP